MMNYFKDKDARAKRAAFITAERAREYSHEIENSIKKTYVFRNEDIMKIPVAKNTAPTEMSVVQADSVSTIFNYTTDSERVAVLNFASYKHPGGMFLLGSSAQEESLCHSSILYNVLSSEDLASFYIINNGDKNRGLYRNRALYSQDVVFFDNRATEEHAGEMRLIDVLTCAAPNASCFLRYNTGEGAEALNKHIMADRIVFIHDIFKYAADKIGLETVVLGAWGCGVFKQDPVTVANLMMTEFRVSKLKRVIFGVPDKGTYEIFKRALEMQ